MLARIIENRVAEVFAETPELGANECALVVEVGTICARLAVGAGG
jgi:hypothetical protein